jgi:hypothetical protein
VRSFSGSRSRTFLILELAAGDDGVVEHVLDRAGEGLGPVEDGQDRPGDVQAPFPQPDDQGGDQGGVLGRAFLDRQRHLDPVDRDPQRHHADMVSEVHPVDHERDQVQPG